jgi:hypothetical protein
MNLSASQAPHGLLPGEGRYVRSLFEPARYLPAMVLSNLKKLSTSRARGFPQPGDIDTRAMLGTAEPVLYDPALNRADR